MEPTVMTSEEIINAKAIWAAYQQKHDLSDRKGTTAGIDPNAGKVWFGESALDIVKKREDKGLHSPLYFIRIGYDYYLRKGYHP